MAVVAAMLAGVGFVAAPVAHADPTPGTAGFLTPASGRVLDTRQAGGPLQPGTQQLLSLGGNNNIPTSGVSAVAITVTAVGATTAGTVSVQPYGATGTPTTTQLSFSNGNTVSNTALVAVSSDVKIQVSVSAATNVLVDLQGYFSSGNGTVAPGGFVPNTVGGQRVADTRATGTAVPQHTVAPNTELTVNLTGLAQIPSTATAVFANITVITHDAGNGYITPYPTGTGRPGTSLNYVGSQNTGLGTIVDINSNEQFTIYVGTGSAQPIDLVVDIEGYYDSADTHGAFTPGSARVYDTTTSANLQMAPNTTREIQVSNIVANNVVLVPAAATGIGALALEMTSTTKTSGTNYLHVWGHDQSEPSTSETSMVGQVTRSNLATVVPGATTDTIFVKNIGNAAIDLTLDVEGWYSTAANLPAASNGNCAASGQRPTSHQLPHQLTDKMSMSWNPVNGNLQLREPLIHLTGAGQSIDFGLRYNSLNDTRPTFSAGWTESAITVNPVNNTVTYTGPDGACYVFTKTTTAANGVVSYSTPPYVNATLTQQDAHTYYLRMNPAGNTNVYKDVAGDGTPLSVWQLVSSSDSTGGNYITYTYNPATNRIASIAEADAPSRKLTFAYTDTRNPLQPSKVTDVALGRTMTFTYAGPSGAMDTVTDPSGAKLTFGYTGNQISSVTDNRNDGSNGGGNTTTFTYDTLTPAHRIASWTYAPVTGASTASTYTAAYPSTTQTTLTDALHPATTFALANTTAAAPAGIGTAVVTITDPLGHATNFTYTAHGDANKTTNALGQAASSSYGGSNYLVNSSTAAGSTSGGTTVAGASTFLNFPGDDRSTTAKDQDGNNVPSCAAASSPLGNYRPCSSTDPQGHTSNYTYDSLSQNVTTVTTSGGAGGTQTFTYQGQSGSNGVADCGAKNGQICSASDGNSNVTGFSYNTRGDLTTIDRPGGLGNIVMTYDAAGRIASRTDGGGNTSYYTYDDDDRPIKVTQNTTTCTYDSTGSCVEYIYDRAGNLIVRGDRTGITAYTFDQQNRMTEKRVTTRDSGTVTADNLATYDAVGNRTSNTDLTDDGNQTTTYGYDMANRVVWLGEPGTTSCPVVTVAQTAPTAGCVLFLYDTANRRTDSYLPNGRDNHVDYDSNGRASYLDNRPYGGNTYGATAGRSYAYTTGPTGTNGQGGAGGLVSGTGTASGAYTSYFRYDGVNRMIDQGGVSNPQDTQASSYWHYDHNGNRTQATTTGTGGSTTWATYNDANQLCWTGTVGGSGITCEAPTTGSTSYIYDAAGNLTASGPTGSTIDHGYSYSIYDQLISTVTGGVTTSYGYADVTSDERTQAGNDTIDNGMSGVNYVLEGTKQVEYIRDPAGTLIEMRVKGVNPWTTQYYTLDRLGSVILLTDTTGATAAAPTYDAWGVTTSAAPTNSIAALNRYGYASGYTDPGTGLIKYGTRYYIPTLGVWTQADPAAQGSNYYIYGGDDPITNADPSGRWSFSVSGCIYYICAEVNVGTDDDDDFTAGGGIGLGTGEDGSGEDLGATFSPGDLTEGNYVSASCSYGDATVGVTGSDDGYEADGGFSTPSGGSCDATVGYNF